VKSIIERHRIDLGVLRPAGRREPDWVEANAAMEEMIAEAGGISEADVAWARSVLGIDAHHTEVA
jgi:hypothetical protein